MAYRVVHQVGEDHAQGLRVGFGEGVAILLPDGREAPGLRSGGLIHPQALQQGPDVDFLPARGHLTGIQAGGDQQVIDPGLHLQRDAMAGDESLLEIAPGPLGHFDGRAQTRQRSSQFMGCHPPDRCGEPVGCLQAIAEVVHPLGEGRQFLGHPGAFQAASRSAGIEGGDVIGEPGEGLEGPAQGQHEGNGRGQAR